MMNETGFQRTLPDQSSGSGYTLDTIRHPSVINPILSKRVCFYKSGDPQYNGLRMVINHRTFKTFEALLDGLSKKVPLPFGVRNITTPRGVHGIRTLDELEDGKSYICSDSHKVKPFDLALARRKLPPWYHTRPVSSRRRTGQLFPGRKNINRHEPIVIRTPKKLVVFRNGDPSVKHTVVLHKKTTPSYESILNYISELMQFHVNKLHTPDGRRVDGLPGLILCSGTVVAVGRESFRPAIYSVQKSPAPTRWHTNQRAFRRQKALNSKKKSPAYSLKSRNFSASSERYMLHQIHNSIVESSCDLPSNLTNSVELDSNCILESAAETEGDPCPADGAEVQDCSLSNDDNIEKSFRVNRDGSMTVEMKVRLTIKEEETVQWTTTLTRSAAADQPNACLPELEEEQEINSNKSNSHNSQSSVASMNIINKDRPKDDNDDDPPLLGNEAFRESCHEENNMKNHTAVVSPRRAPTPGWKRISRTQESVESIKSVTVDGIEEGAVGSYSCREQTENRTMTEQFCMVNQSSTRPIPKPRRLSSVDIKSRDISAFKSSEITEFSKEEITETVLHIYEEQTSGDNFLANVCASGGTLGPATLETGQLSSNNECELQFWGPSAASESVSIRLGDTMSLKSDLHSSSLKADASQRQQSKNPAEGHVKPQQAELMSVASKSKLINKHVQLVVTPRKRQRKSSKKGAEKYKRIKPFSSAMFIKRIYGNKSSSGKKLKKLKKKPTLNWDKGVMMESIPKVDATVKTAGKHSNRSLTLKDKRSSQISSKTSTDFKPPRGILTRQTSLHVEKKKENKSSDLSKSMSLPPFNSSSSATKEYVENWLEKADLNLASIPHKERKIEVFTLARTENIRCEERKEVMVLEEKLETYKTPKPPQDTSTTPSVKLRVQSFENKTSPLVEKSAISHTTTTKTDSYNSLSPKNTQVKPLSNGISSGISTSTSQTLTEMTLGSEEENPETPTDTFSMELPPPPPELLNTEYFPQDAPSVASSSLYRLSSMSSQLSENYPLSLSPTSDKATSPADDTMGKMASSQADSCSTQHGAGLSRTPSIKRAPLVSNGSLERQMFLRKASLDKYTSGNEATPKTTAISTPINTEGDKVPLHGTQQPFEAPPEGTQHSVLDLGTPSFCSSASPASLTSDQRMSSASISSSEASKLSNIQFKETKVAKTSQKETPSPKTLIKRAKIKSSPSPERKFQNKKPSVELQNTSPNLPPETSRPLEKAPLPNIGTKKHVTPNASPSTERKHHQPKELQRASPYSQSLDVVSPPVRHKSSRKFLSGNLSLDNPSESKTPKNTSFQRQSHQTPQARKPAGEMTADDNKVVTADQDKSESGAQVKPQPLNTANQPNMKPVLEKICCSIKSIRQITRNKRPSCLEKSNSLPDFSSHVASTFGSSSKALLAFLAVMTLKEGITNLNIDELNANNVSCAEALKMIDSLREIANIEDSHKLTTSLSNLQQSASKQLLQSWMGFQELGERRRSHSSTPNISEAGFKAEPGPERDCATDETVIDEILDNLDIPGKLREELASLSEAAKSEDDNEEKTDERLELSANQNNHENSNYVPTEDTDSKGNKSVPDVRSIIKNFTDINQPNPSEMISETVKLKPTGWATQEETSEDCLDPVTEHQSDGASFKQMPQERQLDCKTSMDMQSCREVVHYEKQEKQKQQQGDIHDKLPKELANTNGDVRSEKKLVKDSCVFKTEEQYLEFRQLKVQKEENIPDDVLAHDDKLDSNKEAEMFSSANKDLEKTCPEVSEVGEQHSSENDAEVAREDIKQESSEGEGLFHLESQSEEKQPSSNYYVEVNLKGKNSISNTDSESFSEEGQPERQTCSMGLNLSTDDSTGSSDSEDPSSEEEQPVVDCKKLQVIIEESLSGIEEEQDEELIHNLPTFGEQTKQSRWLAALREESEEYQVSSGDEAENPKSPNTPDRGWDSLSENPNLYSKDETSLITTENLEKGFRFNKNDDSGNDHSSSEEHVDELKGEYEQISSSAEEELGYYEKPSSSEEEQATVNKNTEESHTRHQEAPLTTQPEGANAENGVGNLKQPSEEVLIQSVAERVILLERQVSDAQKSKNTPKSSTVRHFSQRKAPVESEDSSSESPTSELPLCTRSAPQSSLSFSYDSSGVVTTEPEGSRVRSIREMFLAKSATDIQQKRYPSTNSSELSELRAGSSGSGGYQSQTSGELSSGEDDSARKSITKGFVRRTIELLYGKKEPKPEEVTERPPSEPDPRKKEPLSIFSPFHAARSKAMSEMSYFNSTNALDAFSEATRCIAFNAQVGPGDCVPIDNGRWLLRENTSMRKSVSDPVGINKTFSPSPQDKELCEDIQADTPYSLFSAKKQEPEETNPLHRKCTYFSLPSESEICQNDPSPASKTSVSREDIEEEKDASEDSKTWAERNGILPSAGVPDFRMKDNKVHPLVEFPPDGEVVLVQPGKCQGIVNRRLHEPDVLDLLYNFCGAHCPIL
ncbi:oxygen-regulated protein 1-like [Kryptolebias marmoratus]|uniref:Oxygen-regulated protein 1-like n=1 Tax=Kryptolebias marmoratus TaxID=37003 RepID=A0A3Q3G9M2_KRYMA|nr:oxygen-regulated protein 1-like [Kryptolebias marmoratus]